MPAQAKLERDVHSDGMGEDVYKIILAFLLMTAPAAVYIFVALS